MSEHWDSEPELGDMERSHVEKAGHHSIAPYLTNAQESFDTSCRRRYRLLNASAEIPRPSLQDRG